MRTTRTVDISKPLCHEQGLHWLKNNLCYILTPYIYIYHSHLVPIQSLLFSTIFKMAVHRPFWKVERTLGTRLQTTYYGMATYQGRCAWDASSLSRLLALEIRRHTTLCVPQTIAKLTKLFRFASNTNLGGLDNSRYFTLNLIQQSNKKQ